MTANDGFPFSDLTLSQRLEKTEARANIEFVEARKKAFPDRGAEWREIGGAYSMFDGVGSPCTQTFCLGVFQPITHAQLDEIEGFYHERNAEVFHEVSPLTDPSSFQLLNERHYQPIEFTSLLYRPIDTTISLRASANDNLRVRQTGKDERQVWADTSFQGWSEYEELAEFLRDLAEVHARSASMTFLAEINDRPVATGALFICDDVAVLAGASTIPAARRQGAQLALLESRLRYAAEHGCNIAMMGALPGGASQRNAERHGFRIAYTRIKWKLSDKA